MRSGASRILTALHTLHVVALAPLGRGRLAYPALVLRCGGGAGREAELLARRRVHWLLAAETGAFLPSW